MYLLASELNIGDPTLPKDTATTTNASLSSTTSTTTSTTGSWKKFPTRGTSNSQQEVEDSFKEIYYQSIDVVVGCIKDRLLQKDYLEVYKHMEVLLIQGNNEYVNMIYRVYMQNIYY